MNLQQYIEQERQRDPKFGSAYDALGAELEPLELTGDVPLGPETLVVDVPFGRGEEYVADKPYERRGWYVSSGMSRPMLHRKEARGSLTATQVNLLVFHGMKPLQEVRIRQAVFLRCVEGMTLDEVGEVLGVSGMRARSLLWRGECALRAPGEA